MFLLAALNLKLKKKALEFTFFNPNLLELTF